MSLEKVLRAVAAQPPLFYASLEMGEFCTPEMVEQRWEHRDFPRMDAPIWSTIAKLIKGHYKTLTWARYPSGQIRGQVMVSPEGIRLMRERADAHPS